MDIQKSRYFTVKFHISATEVLFASCFLFSCFTRANIFILLSPSRKSNRYTYIGLTAFLTINTCEKYFAKNFAKSTIGTFCQKVNVFLYEKKFSRVCVIFVPWWGRTSEFFRLLKYLSRVLNFLSYSKYSVLFGKPEESYRSKDRMKININVIKMNSSIFSDFEKKY